MPKISRRNFMNTVALFTGGAGAIWWDHSAFSSEPKLQFPTLPRDRLAVSSWPFRAFIDSPTNRDQDRNRSGMDMKDFPVMVVNQFGLHKIEPIGDHFGSTDPVYLEKFRKSLQTAEVNIVNIPVTVGASLYDSEAGQRRKAVQNATKWVEIALLLGSPSIQVNIQPLRSSAPNVERAADSLQRITDYAGRKGVVINLENDNLVSEGAFFIVTLIEKVNHPYLRALPDFCNSMLTGNEKFNYEAVAAMFKHAYNISHMKDSEIGPQGKLFKVDIHRTFAIAKAAGYRGYYSMEWEGEGEPYAGTRKLIEESLESLS
jgi:sugar phosphate isomerase/epimerase